MILSEFAASKSFSQKRIKTKGEEEKYNAANKAKIKIEYDPKIDKHITFKTKKIKHVDTSLTVFKVKTNKMAKKFSITSKDGDDLMKYIEDGPLITENNIRLIKNVKGEYKIYQVENGTMAIMYSDDPYSMLNVIGKYSPGFLYRPSISIIGDETIKGTIIVTVPHIKLTNMRKVADYLYDEKEH